MTLLLLTSYAHGQEVREGVLPCGLTYHLLSDSTWSSQRAEARLVLPFGSLSETGRTGVAHFIEHLAFRGTTHFPGDSIRSFVESYGGAFGYDLNALTGLDRTVYLISHPVSQTAPILQIMRDWLTELTLDPVAMDQERRIIREEKRHFVPNDRYDDLLIGTGHAAHRSPLGTDEDLELITQEDLVEYYHRVYRPEHAHVVLAGAAPIEELEQLVAQTFGDLPHSTPMAPPTPERLTYPDTLLFATDADTLYTGHSLRYIRAYPTTHRQSADRVGEELVSKLLSRLLSQATGATLTSWHYLGGTALMELSLEDRDELRLGQRLRHALGMLEQIREQGLGQSQAYLHHFLDRERPDPSTRLLTYLSPSAAAEHQVELILEGNEEVSTDSFFASATPQTLDALARHLLNSCYGEILLYRQGKGGKWTAPDFDRTPDETILLPQLEIATKEPDTVRKAPTLPRPSSTEVAPIATEVLPGLGITIATYPDGHRLIIKALSDPEEVTRLLSRSLGGVADLPHPRYAGLAGVSDTDEATEALYLNGLSTGSFIEPATHGFYAFSEKSAKLPELLTYLYSKFRHPSFDPAELEMEEETEESPSLLRSLIERNPGHAVEALRDTVLCHLVQMPKRRPERSHKDPTAIYRDLFGATAGGYTIICSPLPADSVRMLFGRTLAHLGLPAQSTAGAAHCTLPATGRGYTTPTEETATTHYLSWGSYRPGLRTNLILKIIREALRTQQLQRLRTETGMVYSPALSLDLRAISTGEGRYLLELQNNSLTTNLPRLTTEVEAMVAHPQLTPERLEEIKRGFVANRNAALTTATGSDWMDIITDLLSAGERLSDFEQYEEILSSITVEEVLSTWQSTFLPGMQHRWIIY